MSGMQDNSSLSVCSGAGGLDLGLEAAGWETIAQIEMDADCVGTLEASAHGRMRPPRVIHATLESVSPSKLRRELGLRKGQLALLAGGPPCQPFTTHGLRKAIRDARASQVFPSYLDYVREFMPRAAVMENVDGLLSAALIHRPLLGRTKDAPLAPEEMKGSFLRWLVGEFVALGYSVSWGLVEAADYGVPQYRQRALLIAVKGGEPCYLPPGRPEATRTTLRQALDGLKDPGPIQPLSERKRAIYRLVPAGGNWRDLPRALQEETMGAAFRAAGGKGGWWRRLSWDEPAPTILGMPDHSSTGLIHPDEVRCLGLAECAAIQTFPAETRFSGSARSGYQQVGNAVPPRLAEAIGQHLMSHLLGERSPRPASPPWRQSSANRRIGTHGWAVPGRDSPSTTLNVKVRDDHIWAAYPTLPGFKDDRRKLVA